MSYAMENVEETKRLEAQAKQKGYLLDDELAGLNLPESGSFLDAGCGSGLLSRYLYEKSSQRQLTAVDLSEVRLAQARENAMKLGHKIHFQSENLEKLSFADNTFDIVFCRYVMEHVPSPTSIISELHRVLKPGGRLIVINFDGIVVNMHSNDEKLQSELAVLTQNYPGDLYVARKLPVYFEKCHFNSIQWRAHCQTFQGEELTIEANNTRDRFHFAQDFLEKIYGGKESAAAFTERYFKAMFDPSTTLFYTKFVVQGTK